MRSDNDYAPLETVSLCAQRFHRIHPGGAAGGDEAGQGGDGAEQENDGAVDPEIERVHFEEEVGQGLAAQPKDEGGEAKRDP